MRKSLKVYQTVFLFYINTWSFKFRNFLYTVSLFYFVFKNRYSALHFCFVNFKISNQGESPFISKQEKKQKSKQAIIAVESFDSVRHAPLRYEDTDLLSR